MVTNQQVRILMKTVKTEKTLALSAAKAGMDEKTARKYRRSGRLPSEMSEPHTWRTRPDPFEEVWAEIRGKLEDNAGFEAKPVEPSPTGGKRDDNSITVDNSIRGSRCSKLKPFGLASLFFRRIPSSTCRRRASTPRRNDRSRLR